MNNARLERLIDSWDSARSLDDLNLVPTAGMVAEAKRGLAWRDEFNRGGTAVGVARARDIVNKKRLSPDTVMRMHSFFSRHAVDKKGQGFSGGDGYPSNGRIAWALWGGDAGASWSEKMAGQIQKIRESSAAEEPAFEEGDVVEFPLNGGTGVGTIEHIMTDGYFGVPGSKFYTPASAENPAILIRIWENGDETELMTGRMADEITRASE